MYKFVFKLLKVSTAVFAATFLLAVNSAKAETKTDSALPEAQPGVEVQRTDWSYKTLQQLASRYECLPSDNVIFTTKRDYVSRQVFTTNLSTCLQSMEELMARRRRRPAVKRRVVVPAPVAPVEPVAPEPAPVVPVEPVAPVAPPAPPVVEIQEEQSEPITQQDLDNIKALVSAFDSELAALEKRITSKSFSTTTKLSGEVIIGFGGYGGVPSNATRLSNNNFLANRVRLNFDTSFTGKDRLRTRLQARNVPSLSGGVTGTNMTRLGFDGSEGNDDLLAVLQYDFPLTDSTKVRIGATGYRFNDNQPTLNQSFASSANGAISRFGRFNPILRLAGDGTAVTVAQKLSKELSLDLGYAVPGGALGNTTANAAIVTPTGGSNNGFFGGQNAILSQLTYTPSKEFSIAALYGRTYNNAGGLLGSTGSGAANNPFNTTAINGNIVTPTTNPSGAGKASGILAGTGAANANTTANHYSVLASYKLSDSAIISGWAGFVEANQTTGGGSASISNYAITLAFPNFGAEGNMLGFVFGIPPKLNSRTVTIGGATNTSTGNPDTSYHLEALYKVKLNDNIDITPGLLLITNPEHNSANPTEYVGTVRTTFLF